MAWDTVLTTEGDLTSDMAAWETDVSPSSVDDVSMTHHGKNRVVVLIQYSTA